MKSRPRGKPLTARIPRLPNHGDDERAACGLYPTIQKLRRPVMDARITPSVSIHRFTG